VGVRVRCEGLTGAADLNGCLGRVVSHEGARAKVRIDGGGAGARVVGVKPHNLVVVAVVAGGEWATQAQDPEDLVRALGRGLHSFTSQLNLGAFCGIGGAHRGCVARVKGVLGGVQGVFGCQTRLKSS